MKKLVFLILLVIPLLLEAQTYDKTFESDETYLIADYTGFAGDTIGVGDSVWTYTVRHYQPSKVFYDFYLDVDSTGGTASDVNVIFQGRLMSVDDWTDIDTVVWSATGDTTFHFTQTTTATPYKDLRCKVEGTDDSFKAEIQRFVLRLLLDD